MKSSIASELRELSTNDLELKIDEWRRQLLTLRLSMTSSHLKDYSQFKKIRSNIARGMTILGQKCHCACGDSN